MSQPWWLGIAVLGSFVVGMFDKTLGAFLLTACITVLVFLTVPTIFMLPRLWSPDARRANAALKEWSESFESQAYVLSSLVKDSRVEWGVAVPFVEDVIRAAKLPPGTPLAAVANNAKQARFLRALGFQPLEHDGVTTQAMVRKT
ncbi:hypothetical protein [Paenarthrobacter aurescens]|nr:hypothetical protein [Paenarthrobacter aurescens]MDO6144590.1 hypothetical protein [Paenarthrobacter aurescens]MDO6148435.1 hypothetical protein [Paenarthrobacter aurescens]MDO6159681.1 hypothetical protein [Paenarthrobacter aurescens]MDO6164583.1 hypothetical protein [Paenarthrobacter aurescens]